jgi:hypothetical protein
MSAVISRFGQRFADRCKREGAMKLTMEIETVQKLLTEVALSHPKEDDSAELKALRSISLALLHIAAGVDNIQSALQCLDRR